ncbi:response regulator [Neobacillus soli]|uniref:response regulator n=1 Tax=Neobacillus soli TaxID=220688 RepID=UPI000824CECA|nr:response regulator [Neobacillus soli]
MLFYIVDDDDATRAMLAGIIEDEDLGVVVGEARDGSMIDEHLFTLKKVRILLIDFLMPIKDGIETINDIKPIFNGKTVMISQIESKELIAEAYSYGVEYYITKPINKIEVLSVIKKVIDRIYLEESLHNIHQLARNVLPDNTTLKKNNFPAQDFTSFAQHLLSELGIVGESGYQDLLDVLDYLHQYERVKTFKDGFPHLKDIFLKVVQGKHESSPQPEELNRDIKASKQRTRRAIYQSLNRLASLGLNDFTNPIFENYAPNFFDFAIVQERMREIKKGKSLPTSQIRINTKKFIQVLYFETQRLTSAKSN